MRNSLFAQRQHIGAVKEQAALLVERGIDFVARRDAAHSNAPHESGVRDAQQLRCFVAGQFLFFGRLTILFHIS